MENISICLIQAFRGPVLMSDRHRKCLSHSKSPEIYSILPNILVENINVGTNGFKLYATLKIIWLLFPYFWKASKYTYDYGQCQIHRRLYAIASTFKSIGLRLYVLSRTFNNKDNSKCTCEYVQFKVHLILRKIQVTFMIMRNSMYI